jgi:hypothetical protein
MSSRLVASSLLLAVLSSTLAVSHPCLSARPGHAASPVRAHPACHGQAAHQAAAGRQAMHRETTPAKRGDCCDPRTGNHGTCPNSAQAFAVLGPLPALPAPLFVMARMGRPAASSISLFSSSIDHIPLA